MQPIKLSDIFYFKNNPSQSYMILGKLDIHGDNQQAQVKAYLSSTNIIYMSEQSLYMATHEFINSGSNWFWHTVSHVARFSLSTLGFTGNVTVDGTVSNRHYIGEHEGYLRIAATYRTSANVWNSFASGVYSYNSNLKLISKITDIAPGEALDSVAFSGNYGYISTSPMGALFDPLFTIDFTDPYDITISEGLTQEGVNSYLKNVDGTNYVIGIGIDSDAMGTRIGLKIEFYDMTPGLMPESLFKHTFDGMWSNSEALWNPRAILYMYDESTGKGLIGFAVETVEYIPITVTTPWGAWNTTVYTTTKQGFQLFEFCTENGTMQEYGYLSNFATDEYVYQYNWSEWCFDTYIAIRNLYITRAIVNNGYLYTIADGKITGYNLDLEFLGELVG
jgi:uncharacterized secreted protein with C-terminal beta-propeller domain